MNGLRHALVSFAIIASLLSIIPINAAPVLAKNLQNDEDRTERFVTEANSQCPVRSPLRVAGQASIERFVALRACTNVIEGDRPLMPPVAPPRESQAPPEDPDRARSNQRNQVDAQPTEPKAEPGSSLRIVPKRDEKPSSQLSLALEQLALAAAVPSGEALFSLAPRSYKTGFDSAIAVAARRHAVDPLLLHAIIRQESNYRSKARSRAGAIGLMQITPGTGATLGFASTQLYDPGSNIDAGARLLRRLNARYRGNVDLMLAAYNAGEGAVARYGNRIPPYRETLDYVKKVKANYARLAGENGLAGLVR